MFLAVVVLGYICFLFHVWCRSGLQMNTWLAVYLQLAASRSSLLFKPYIITGPSMWLNVTDFRPGWTRLTWRLKKADWSEQLGVCQGF